LKKDTITKDSLRQSGLRYLERYTASTQSFRRVLMKKAARVGLGAELDNNQVSSWIDSIITRFIEVGLLNDYQVARNHCESLIKRGTATSRIIAKLQRKGFERHTVDHVIKELEQEGGVADMKAALNLVKRKKLGPYRPEEERSMYRKRDLEVMGRAGFSYLLSQKIIDSPTIEFADNLLAL